MSDKKALEIADKRLEEQRKDMDREPLGKTTEQGLGAKGSDRTGEENKKPSLIEKKLSDKALPTENSKLTGLVERRLDTSSKNPYPHRNPDAWERTGDKRQINNLESEQGEASDEKRGERFEKADKSAQDQKKRILDKDIGKQLTNKKAFNLSAVENQKKYGRYSAYLNYKAGTGPFSNKISEVKAIDEKLTALMSQKRELTVDEQKQVEALKNEKSGLLKLAMSLVPPPGKAGFESPEPPPPPSSIGKRPEVGQVTEVHNMKCKIIKVHRAGTIDVECPNGKNYRVTGLGFI